MRQLISVEGEASARRKRACETLDEENPSINPSLMRQYQTAMKRNLSANTRKINAKRRVSLVFFNISRVKVPRETPKQ